MPGKYSGEVTVEQIYFPIALDCLPLGVCLVKDAAKFLMDQFVLTFTGSKQLIPTKFGG